MNFSISAGVGFIALFGVAIIKIGGSSEVEVLEKKDRLDDAIGATKAAIAEGFLPGGGTVLLRVSEEIYKDKGDSLSEGEIMLLNAIRKPFQQLLINSGFELDDISSKLLESEDKYLIYDFLDYEFVNAIDKGIIEPKLTLKMAIENSVSVASLVLTTSCAIVDDPDKNQSVPLI
jgi:chaperonin GroEL